MKVKKGTWICNARSHFPLTIHFFSQTILYEYLSQVIRRRTRFMRRFALCSPRWMHVTSLRLNMTMQWWRPSGETPSLSRFSDAPLPEQLPLWYITTAVRRRMCVWSMSARKRTSPSSTSWHWPSFGLLPHPSPTSVLSCSLTGKGKHLVYGWRQVLAFHLLKRVDFTNYVRGWRSAKARIFFSQHQTNLKLLWGYTSILWYHYAEPNPHEIIALVCYIHFL